MRAFAVAALLVVAGCKSSTPGSVDLTIIADASLSDTTVAAIGVLEISVSGAATISEPYLVSKPFSTGRQERLVVRPPVSAGTLTIAVLAHDSGGKAVGFGQTDVTLKSSGSAAATVTLTSDVPVGDGGVVPTNDMAVSGPSLQLVAGHVGGQGFADGSATVARFFNPRGIVIVGGNAFVADMNNHVIRQIALATGAVTTLAGSPLRRGSADGTGAAAHFNRPTSITSDGTNLYVSDMRNHTVRQIVIATGVVTTLAGTAGAAGSTDMNGNAARFDHPHGIVCDGAGNLYVADAYNHTIRKIVIAGAVVSTLAGTAGMRAFSDGTGAAARFNSPHGLAFAGGNLYVADTSNHAIRMVTPAGVVTTPYGQGGAGGMVDAVGTTARFNAPRGVVGDAAGNLYVADGGNERVRKIVLSSNAVTTLAGHDAFGSVDGTGAGAGFAGPFGVAVDGSGNLYVTESFGHTVRKVTATGTTTTFAGLAGADGIGDGVGAAALFRRPHALCFDGGALYVTDKQNHAVRKIDPTTGTVTTLAGSGQPGIADGVGALAQLNSPFGCAADGAGKLYISDGNHTIRAITLATGAVTTVAGTATKTGTTDDTGALARFNNPAGLAIAGGTLYISDANNHTVRAMGLTSTAVTTLAGTGGSSGSADMTGAAARFNRPNGLAVDGGNLYVADQGNHAIRRVTLPGAVVTTIAGAAGMIGATDGNGGAARFFSPHALASDGNGNLFVADTLNNTVRKIVTATGDVTTLAGVAGLASVKPGALPGILNSPTGLVVGSGGAIYVATAHENAVVVIR